MYLKHIYQYIKNLVNSSRLMLVFMKSAIILCCWFIHRLHQAAFVVNSERATASESQRGRISTKEAGLIMGRVWSPLIRLKTGLGGKQIKAKSLHSSFHKIQDVIFIFVCLAEIKYCSL